MSDEFTILGGNVDDLALNALDWRLAYGGGV